MSEKIFAIWVSEGFFSDNTRKSKKHKWKKYDKFDLVKI